MRCVCRAGANSCAPKKSCASSLLVFCLDPIPQVSRRGQGWRRPRCWVPPSPDQVGTGRNCPRTKRCQKRKPLMVSQDRLGNRPWAECREFNSIDNQLPLPEMRRGGIQKRPRERSLSSSRDPRDGQQDTLRAALQSSPGPASTIRLSTQPKPTEMLFLWCRELLQQQLVLYP